MEVEVEENGDGDASSVLGPLGSVKKTFSNFILFLVPFGCGLALEPGELINSHLSDRLI